MLAALETHQGTLMKLPQTFTCLFSPQNSQGFGKAFAKFVAFIS